jgi:hypothetical protein
MMSTKLIDFDQYNERVHMEISVGIYCICWKVIMYFFYVGSCPRSYVKEYKTNILYLLWNSLLLAGILYKQMIKKRIILSHMQYVRVIP